MPLNLAYYCSKISTMPQITLDDAKAALQKAFDMYLDQNPNAFQINVGGVMVNIIYQKTPTHLNFGFPNIYPLKKSEFQNLQSWVASNPAKAKVLPPQKESGAGHEKVNVIIPGAVTLNFHIPLV